MRGRRGRAERRGRGERRLEDALDALRRALNDTRAPWMVIGGLAVIARGVRRLTTDIDAVVQGDAIEIDALLRHLARHQIMSRIPDAKAFARANLILLVTHKASGVELDVSLGWTGFEREALAARSELSFGSVTVPMAQAEDLVIFKVLAGRARDLDDATTLIDLYPQMDRTRLRKTVQELAQLIDEPQRIEVLERILEGASSPPRNKPRKSIRRRSPAAKPRKRS